MRAKPPATYQFYNTDSQYLDEIISGLQKYIYIKTMVQKCIRCIWPYLALTLPQSNKTSPQSNNAANAFGNPFITKISLTMYLNIVILVATKLRDNNSPGTT